MSSNPDERYVPKASGKRCSPSEKELKARDKAFINKLSCPSLVEPSGDTVMRDQLLNAMEILERRGSSGLSMLDHFENLTKKYREERPENYAKFVKEYSYELRQAKHMLSNEELEVRFYEPYKSPSRLSFSQTVLDLIEEVLKAGENPIASSEAIFTDEDDNTTNQISHGLQNQLPLFQEAGISMPDFNVIELQIALAKLIVDQPLAKIRFWGIIYGTKNNYYIAECELTEEENMRRNMEEFSNFEITDLEVHTSDAYIPPFASASMILQDPPSEHLGEDRGNEANQQPPSPLDLYRIPAVPTFPEPPVIEVPKEEFGQGANKSTYFVINTFTDDWVILPDVTPQQIVAARQIVHYFTGDLEAPIDNTYPRFPGVEKNYLRAQIARITAGTHISPLGWYIVGGSGEDEGLDEDAQGGEVQKNPLYEALPAHALLHTANWVHHAPYILLQGRTTFWKQPVIKDEGLGEEEGGDEENEAVEEPEIAPELLTPIKEDVKVNKRIPWRTRSSCALMPDLSYVVVQSVVWPGAYAVSNGKLFDLLYVGWGVKNQTPTFSPTPLRAIKIEYELGPEIMEILDPTPEEEEAWRIAHLPPPIPVGGLGEEEQGNVEEEEEEEEDD